MSHFAQVIDGIVQRVIVAEQDFIDTGAVGDPKNWIQTSYNNRIRNKYAGIGDLYLADRDMFIRQKPFPSWIIKSVETTTLDENYNIVTKHVRYDWFPPVDMPSTDLGEGYGWAWDEQTLSWVQKQIPN